MANLIPPPVTYPGVYIQEIASGSRTITGAPTSIAAFVGRTRRGPVNRPVQIDSFGVFIQLFGGLDFDTPMTYAVQDFFNNGGTTAWICRVWAADAGDGTAVFGAPPPAGPPPKQDTPVGFQAANPGAWGDGLKLTISRAPTSRAVPPELAALGLTTADLFDITIEGPTPGRHGVSSPVTQETFRDCAVHPDAGDHRIDRVLTHQSLMARVLGNPDAETFEQLHAGMPEDTDTQTAAGGVDSQPLVAADYTDAPDRGLHLLDQVDIFNILAVPPDRFGQDTDPAVLRASLERCHTRRAILIVDAPIAWQAQIQAQGALPADFDTAWSALGLSELPTGRNAAVYFPYVTRHDPLHPKIARSFPPCGIVAGVYARTDAQFGVAKAPAGLQASMNGIEGLTISVNDDLNGALNSRGINVLRTFPAVGDVIWGARTARGADALASDYKYLSVRRLALFIEASLYGGLGWTVFEPNTEETWQSVRQSIGTFLDQQFRSGSLAGATQKDAYFVKVDSSTTTAYDVEQGVMNMVVGFAPMKPAEFIVLYLELKVGSPSP
jgi:uncharacterized protein